MSIALERKVMDLEKNYRAIEAAFDELLDRVEKLEARRGPGRPPNKAAEDVPTAA